MKKYDWDALKREYVTGDLSVSELARNHAISYGAVNWHCKKENWKETRQKYRESQKTPEETPGTDFSKELDIASRLEDILLEAIKDDRQFYRYLIKGKESTDEMIFGKVDMDSIHSAIRALKSLEEIKSVMNEVLSPGKESTDEETQKTGVVILPEIEEEKDET